MNLLKFFLRRPYWFFRFQLPMIIEPWKMWLLYQKHRSFTHSRKAKERAVMRLFQKYQGYSFDFDNPQTLSEKIAVRKLSDDPRLPVLADKFAVREYVRDTVGEEYLIPLVFTGMEFTEDDFRKLPRRCVIKTVNASATNIMIFDKEKEDAKKIIRRVRRMQKLQYGFFMMELFYNRIPPRVIVEEMLTGEDGKVPCDYKFHCFPHADGGRGKIYIYVDFGRFDVHTRNMYDENWELCPFRSGFFLSGPETPRPENLDEMLNVARKLAGDWPYVRIDMYNTGRRIYFGEMTFTPNAATEKFSSLEWDRKLGEEWKE